MGGTVGGEMIESERLSSYLVVGVERELPPGLDQIGRMTYAWPQAEDTPPPSRCYWSTAITRCFSGAATRSFWMASAKVRPLPHLDAGEVALVDFAADDPRDNVTLSDKEASILQHYQQIQEQELEKALLQQDTEYLSGDDAAEQLAVAERELLEARATYTVRKKAMRTVLMTEPTLKAVHLKATTPVEQALLGLVNRRDVLSLAHENLTAAQNATLRKLSDVEVENLRLHRINKDLVQELLELTKDDESWREKLDDADLKAQLDQVRIDYKKSKAKWDTMKSVASAIVVGSGVNWADDEDLVPLVLDESDD